MAADLLPRNGVVAPPAVRVRSRALDAVRGLAIVLMICDHLLIWQSWGWPLRLTVTRASMPLFFVVSGHLVRRLTWRHAAILGIGLLLPFVVPWIDAPNVLAWYVIGAVVIVQTRRLAPWLLPVLVAVPLVQYANLLDVHPVGTGYMPSALVGLMAFGALLPRAWFSWGDRLPRALALAGRFPLSVYVGHLLALQAFLLLWRSA